MYKDIYYKLFPAIKQAVNESYTSISSFHLTTVNNNYYVEVFQAIEAIFDLAGEAVIVSSTMFKYGGNLVITPLIGAKVRWMPSPAA